MLYKLFNFCTKVKEKKLKRYFSYFQVFFSLVYWESLNKKD